MQNEWVLTLGGKMQSGPDGEKRWTIVLSVDMVDSTAVMQAIGNEPT